MVSMPSTASAAPASPPSVPAAAAGSHAAAAAQLAQASHALWIATLSLMTAFMHTAAPAHRLLLSRRIARNFETLAGQECFDAGCRAKFAGLARRWQARSEEFDPARERRPLGLLQSLRSFLT
jgi:hypothetical protein